MITLPDDWQQMLEKVDERRRLHISAKRNEAENIAATHFAVMALEAIEQRGAFYVALSGGSTPVAIYKTLTEPYYKNSIDWKKVHLFWSDERCVPPTHPDSNYWMAMASGLQYLGIPSEQIHRMRGEEIPKIGAQKYGEGIKLIVPGAIFDLVMLGMGEDGHTASLFPKSAGLEEWEQLVIANEVEAKERWRLTLTFPCINQARQAVFYALGGSKANMLRRVLLGQEKGDPLPAQMIGTAEHPALWIVDAAAANLLPHGR